MSNVLRLAIVDPNDASRETIKALLLGMDLVWLEAECSRYEFFSDVVDQTEPDVGAVCLDEDPDQGLNLVARLHETSSCAILVMSSSNDGSLILRAMRAGAKEFLTQPIDAQDLIGALERISNARSGTGTGKSRGCTTIAIAGASGGVGATSLAVNIGCSLAADESNSVALVDLDLAVGDADVFLDSIPDYTLVDVAHNVARLDFALLKKSMTKHSSGLYLLPRPVQLQDGPLIAPDDFSRVVGLLKATFSHLVFDLSKSYGVLDMVAMRQSLNILLVTQLDLPCLRNVVRLMMSFEEEEGLKEKVKIVINRLGLDAEHIGLKKAQETINSEIYWRIPNDYRSMSEARNNGVPLNVQAPKAAVTQAVASLAAALNGDLDDESEAMDARDKKGGVSKWLPFLGNNSRT
jgi:pilus assembly protein CpaE